jgi:hypothetical protein
MATLKAHGELGQIEKLVHKVAYCADGNLLRSMGDGWKLWKRLKPGIDATEFWIKAQAHYAAKLQNKPAYAAYRAELHELVCFKNRYFVNNVVATLGNDADGVWSELESESFRDIDLSLEDCEKLCRLQEAADAEAKEIKRRAAGSAVAA